MNIKTRLLFAAIAAMSLPVLPGLSQQPQNAAALSITGTAGAGYVKFGVAQSAAPSAPSAGFTEFADATGRVSWRRASDTFIRTFDSTLTANRVYTLPDAAIIFSGSASALTSGRVPFVTTGGLLADAAAFTFNSGTGALSVTSLTLTTALTVANGGTGAATFTANNILTGNTTGAIQASGATITGSGNILTLAGGVVITDTSGAVTIAAAAGNKSITLTPTGTGQIVSGIAGTAASPSLTWISDLTTGLYGLGGGELGYTGSGTLRWKFSYGADGGGLILQPTSGSNFGFTASGTGNIVFRPQNTLALTLDASQNATLAGNVLRFVSTKGIQGSNTNDNVAAGYVGEYTSSAIADGSGVSLTDSTSANLTSLTLAAGDWEVAANVNFIETTSTVTARTAGLSTTSATLPTDGSQAYNGVQSTVTSEKNTITLPPQRFSLSTSTTVYIAAQAAFSAGTCKAGGLMTARRMR